MWFLLIGIAALFATTVGVTTRQRIVNQRNQELRENYFAKRFEKEQQELLEKERTNKPEQIIEMPAQEKVVVEEKKVEQPVVEEKVAPAPSPVVPPIVAPTPVVEPVKNEVKAPKPAASTKPVDNSYTPAANQLLTSLKSYRDALAESPIANPYRILSIDKTIVAVESAITPTGTAEEKFNVIQLHNKLSTYTVENAPAQFSKLVQNAQKAKSGDTKAKFSEMDARELDVLSSYLYNQTKSLLKNDLNDNKKTPQNEVVLMNTSELENLREIRKNARTAIKMLETYKVALIKLGGVQDNRLIAINSLIEQIKNINDSKISRSDALVISQYMEQFKKYDVTTIENRREEIKKELGKPNMNKEFVKTLVLEIVIINSFVYSKTQNISSSDTIKAPVKRRSPEEIAKNNKKLHDAKKESGLNKDRVVKKESTNKPSSISDETKLELLKGIEVLQKRIIDGGTAGQINILLNKMMLTSDAEDTSLPKKEEKTTKPTNGQKKTNSKNK